MKAVPVFCRAEAKRLHTFPHAAKQSHPTPAHYFAQVLPSPAIFVVVCCLPFASVPFPLFHLPPLWVLSASPAYRGTRLAFALRWVRVAFQTPVAAAGLWPPASHRTMEVLALSPSLTLASVISRLRLFHSSDDTTSRRQRNTAREHSMCVPRAFAHPLHVIACRNLQGQICVWICCPRGPCRGGQSTRREISTRSSASPVHCRRARAFSFCESPRQMPLGVSAPRSPRRTLVQRAPFLSLWRTPFVQVTQPRQENAGKKLFCLGAKAEEREKGRRAFESG
ncbi:hypothetical protein TRVL_09352 [Trypanosoma vivax]|nr:hypothetical protein TRVL_09352 [Trypanosoma vivax]